MGLQIGEIVPRKAISFEELRSKTIAIDASNVIYQFLSSIRQADGTPLMDSEGKITSHLSGLFYRNINLIQEGIKLIYVFDGEMPELKHGTNLRRQEVKEEAREKYEKAKAKEDIESMGKYAKQLTKLTDEILNESKELLEAMGIAIIQAPGEAEAQASYMARHNKEIYAVGSQDYDALLHGTPRLIQNLTLARKRKTVSGWVYISPELIELENVLNSLQINLEQLICIGILSGTDYNPGGIRGIGQKRALEIVKKYKEPYLIFKSVESLLEKQENQFDWKEIFEMFKKPNVEKNPKIEKVKFDKAEIKKILISRDFSEERIDSALERLKEAKEKGEQKTLF